MMKHTAKILCLLLTAMAFAGFANADDLTGHYYGEIRSVSPDLAVMGNLGQVQKYKIDRTKLITSSIDVEYRRVKLHHWGKSTSCTQVLGQLTEPFQVTLQTEEGQMKAVTVQPSDANGRRVIVSGACTDNSSNLTDVKIDIENGEI